MLGQIFMAAAAILAGLSVAAGAFAAHALKEKLTENALTIFEKGAKYQMYHALALLLVALLILNNSTAPTYLNVAGFAFIVGIVIFSGSLYTLSLSGIKWLGAITPIGGAAFLIGWGSLAIAAWKWGL